MSEKVILWIIYLGDNVVKVTDFNVSKFCEHYKDFSNKSKHILMWTYTGTIAYSAPEIFIGGIYKYFCLNMFKREYWFMVGRGNFVYHALRQLTFWSWIVNIIIIRYYSLNDLIEKIKNVDYNFS